MTAKITESIMAYVTTLIEGGEDAAFLRESWGSAEHKRCAEENCNCLNPVFNVPTETKGLYCKKHATEDMIDVKSKRCAEENCNCHPVFNVPTETKGLYCKKHATEDMVDVMSKRCAEENCNSLNPAFNVPTETKGLYCSSHRKPGMVNIRNKHCGRVGCKEDACFGVRDGRAQYCELHSRPGMINVVLDRKCSKCESEYDVISEEGVKYCLVHTDPQQQKRMGSDEVFANPHPNGL
jgi:hypothetical protein